MATSKSTKTPDYNVEDDDFFGAQLQKKIRKFKKKLKEIEELEQKPEAELDELQLEKISTRAEQEEGIAHCEELLKVYIQAYAECLQENPDKLPIVHLTPGKKELKKLEKKSKDKPVAAVAQTAEKSVLPPPPPVVEAVSKHQAAPPSVDLEVRLAQVLNLVHFAQFFSDQNRRQEFQNMLASSSNPKDVVGVDNVPDFGIIFEFYTKIFTYTEGSKLDRNVDKIQHAVHELQRFLLQNKEPALKNKSYGHLFETVQNVVNSNYFREKNAEVHHHHVETRQQPQGAIGSEIRGQQHQTSSVVAPPPQQPAVHRVEPVQQPVAAAPQPEPKQAEAAHPPAKTEDHPAHPPAVAQTQKPNRPNWNEFEDDEGEGDGEGDDEYVPVEPRQENQKDDDGFIMVKDRRDEKAAQQQSGQGQRRGGRGRGRGGRGRGGRGGGPRPPREGGDGGNWRGPRRGGGPRSDGQVQYLPVQKEGGVVQQQ